MAFAEKLIAVRRAHHLTQEQLAAKLFVTRQAVSRWERGEVTPGIDMMKLIAAVTGEPLSHLLEMPERYCQSCGMILTPDDCGTDATGAATDHYCKWCYDHGQYTYDTTMEAMIEDCAPRLAQNTGLSLDEAVSLMGAVLPQLELFRERFRVQHQCRGAQHHAEWFAEQIDCNSHLVRFSFRVFCWRFGRVERCCPRFREFRDEPKAVTEGVLRHRLADPCWYSFPFSISGADTFPLLLRMNPWAVSERTAAGFPRRQRAGLLLPGLLYERKTVFSRKRNI